MNISFKGVVVMVATSFISISVLAVPEDCMNDIVKMNKVIEAAGEWGYSITGCSSIARMNTWPPGEALAVDGQCKNMFAPNIPIFNKSGSEGSICSWTYGKWESTISCICNKGA